VKRVLIVEDNLQKKDAIERLLTTSYRIEARHVNSISASLPTIERESWDLVILDMTFQITTGGGQALRKEALAGLEVLQFMAAKRITSPVIVATQHTVFSHGAINVQSVQALEALLRRSFPRVYRTTVFIDLNTDDWHAPLLDAAKDVLQ
jgi:DNA-binding NtrC family response regulator